jgi:peptidyl-prolyl cis-trans isomerase C
MATVTRTIEVAMRLLREPLLHFLLAGALLFAVDAALRASTAPSEQRISITAAEIESLRTQWAKQYRRLPGPTELQGLVDARVREEVLYREALAMGLDRDDSMIRRQLAQRLEFLIEDLAAAREPSEAELSAFLTKHQAAYRRPARVSFSHVYFSPDRRGRAAAADASLVLAGLRAGTRPASAADRGDRFMMGDFYSEQSAQDIEAVFGPEFARALFEVAPGDGWSGPIASAYGWHLVRVEAQSAPRLPALAEVADRVRQDWSYEQRRQANDAVFERLLGRYEVVIEAASLLEGDPEARAPEKQR